MRTLPIPAGWMALEDHLLNDHDVPLEVVDQLSAADARAMHAEAHDSRYADARDSHRHHT